VACMPDDYVTLRTCPDVHTANVMRSVLAGSGIDALIPHETFASTFPHLLAGSGGVRILVRVVDLERAGELLQQAERASVLETERLSLRQLTEDDAPFILHLLNEPSFIEFIGDRGVRTLDDARRYLQAGPLASYEQYGFGLYLVQLRERGIPIGICGLLKRDQLEHADIGFSLLPEFWSEGYALEAAAAVVDYARVTLGLGRLVAITSPHNERSARLLGKLGFAFERNIRMTPEGEELKLFGAG